MEDQHLLEQWTEQELGSMEVDEVFAPYIIRMIDLSQDLVQLHESIVEVLMGWCAQEHEVRRHVHLDEFDMSSFWL